MSLPLNRSVTTTTTAAAAALVFVLLVRMAVATAALMSISVVVAMATTALMIVIMAVAAAATVVTMVVIVMMTTLTVNMAMGNLFGSSRTHVTHGHGKVQVHARQRVVGINLDIVFSDFDHGDRTVTVIGIGHEGIAFGHFHAVKQFTRYLLYQIFFVFTVSIGGIDVQFEAVTDFTVIQGLFQAGNQETGTVQINQRLAAFGGIQHVTRFVGNGVVEGNYAQMANFHVQFPL